MVLPSLALVALLGACTQQAEPTTAPAAPARCDVDTQRETVVSPPQIPEVPEQQANLVLKLSSSSAVERAVTVRASGRTLLDVRLPAVPRGCLNGGSVFVHRYRLPAAATVVEATANAERSTAAVTPGLRKQWVTVLPQDGFPLDVKVWADEPLFG